MSFEDVLPTSELNPEVAYLIHFRQHLEHTHSYLQGCPDRSYECDTPTISLPPSYTENPVSYWASAEKSAFFHALAIHSRLRPDLIAASIQSKNVAEVCAYMDSLESALQIENIERGDKRKREDISSALEVSEEWVEWEETQAAAMLAYEAALEKSNRRGERAEERDSMRRKVMPRQKIGETRTEEDRRRMHEDFKNWSDQSQRDWDGEDLLSSMGPPHFKVIDHILREGVELEEVCASRQATEEPSVPSSTPAPETGPISPASRRRLRKRLYMRRKRAEASGRRVDELPAVPLKRVKPGRKSRPRKKFKTEKGSVDIENGDHDDDDHDDDGNEEEDEEEDTRHPHIGGKTLHYKIKSQLENANMNADALRDNGLGLFHLSALSKLIRLMHPTLPGGVDAPSMISASTIQFLNEHIVAYTTELVHRAIVSRESERALKGHTKVWRFDSGVVLPATIEHARQMLGGLKQTREEFLDGLFEPIGVGEEKDSFDGEDAPSDEPDSDEGDGDSEVESSDENSSSDGSDLDEDMAMLMHREIYAPLFRLPASLSEGPLLPADMDEVAYAAELHEETELDERERIIAEREQRILWAEYGPQETQLICDEPDEIEGR